MRGKIRDRLDGAPCGASPASIFFTVTRGPRVCPSLTWCRAGAQPPPLFFLFCALGGCATAHWRGRGSRSRRRQGDVRGQPRRHRQAVSCGATATALLGAGVGGAHGGAVGRPQARFARRRARVGAERAGRSPRRRDPWRGGVTRARVRCANRATAAWGGVHGRSIRADAHPPMAVFHCSGNPRRGASQVDCRRVPGTAERPERGPATRLTSRRIAAAQAMLRATGAARKLCWRGTCADAQRRGDTVSGVTVGIVLDPAPIAPDEKSHGVTRYRGSLTRCDFRGLVCGA